MRRSVRPFDHAAAVSGCAVPATVSHTVPIERRTPPSIVHRRHSKRELHAVVADVGVAGESTRPEPPDRTPSSLTAPGPADIHEHLPQDRAQDIAARHDPEHPPARHGRHDGRHREQQAFVLSETRRRQHEAQPDGGGCHVERSAATDTDGGADQQRETKGNGGIGHAPAGARSVPAQGSGDGWTGYWLLATGHWQLAIGVRL